MAEKKKTKMEERVVEIPEIKLERVKFEMEGETTLIIQKPPAYLADYMRALMDRRKGEPFPPKPPKVTPEEEAKACLHLTGDLKNPFGIPAGAFHGSMVQAAKEILHLPVDHIRLFRVVGKTLPIVCDDIVVCSKDVVFRGNKEKKEELRTHFPVTVYRPHFNPPWYVSFEIVFKPDVISIETLGQIVQYAGQFIGVGGGRPGLGGHETNGVNHIVGTKVVLKAAA